MYYTSELTNELSAALAIAQSQMDAAKKSGTNPRFKSKYAKLEDMLAACLPSLNENGLSISFTPCMVNAYDLMVCTLMHKSGQYIRAGMRLLNPNNDMQGFGSACTYAKRYMVAGMVGLSVDENDDDGNACSPDKKIAPKKEEEKFITKSQAEEIEKRILALNGGLLKDLLSHYKIESVNELTPHMYKSILQLVTTKEKDRVSI